MKTTSNQEIERNFAIFLAVVHERKTYSEISDKNGFSRQRGSKIVAAVAKRIQHMGHTTDQLDKTIINGLEAMRNASGRWVQAAEAALSDLRDE